MGFLWSKVWWPACIAVLVGLVSVSQAAHALVLPAQLYKPEWVLPLQPITPRPDAAPLLRRAVPMSDLTYRHHDVAKPLSEFIQAGKVHSLLVLHEGKVAYEYNGRWLDDETSRHQSWSMMKQVLAVLVGIAIDDKAIASVDDPMDKYAPELAKSAFAGVTFRQALLMSTGVAYNEEKDRVQLFVRAGLHRFSGGYKGQSVRQAVLDPALQRSEPAGKRYAYASINSQALSMALQAAVKQPLHLYLQDKLWRPLGIPDEARLLSDDEGEGFSLCCIYASPRSFAMLGQLMAQGGRWQGKQIVSSRWVTRATTFADPQAWHARDVPRTAKSMQLFGYAYHWWPLEGDRGDFVAQGILGQSIYVSPRQNVVVVRLGHDETPGAHAEEGVALARAVADHLAPRGK
jgi:CubicO group peptidase (beta-lactamase class C family)